MKFIYNNQEYDLILFSLAGSRFYGTHFDGKGSDLEHPFDPDYVSDSDWRGVFVAPEETKLGLLGTIEQIEVKKDKSGNVPKEQQELIKELNDKLDMTMAIDEDITLYEVKKFVNLAMDNNPNIMDILFADKNSISYKTRKGEELLSHKQYFLSSKTKHTFSGYAMSQLKRIKGHNKMIVQYPKTNVVINKLKESFSCNNIDYNWISDHFSGKLATFITGLSQQEANKLGKQESLSWNEFIDKYSDNGNDTELTINKNEWDNYRKPQLIDYCYAKTLTAQTIDKTNEITIENNDEVKYKGTLYDFLLEQASFRTISPTQYNIFTPSDDNFKGGIFARNGDLKVNDPEEVGKFVCQLTIDKNTYKKDYDAIQKLWDWRTNRNIKRSILEEKFGYDTKHSAHLFRLLLGAKKILQTGNYAPRLEGEELQLVREILTGKYPYEWIIEESQKLEKELDEYYKTSNLPKSPERKKINELLVKLSKNRKWFDFLIFNI